MQTRWGSFGEEQRGHLLKLVGLSLCVARRMSRRDLLFRRFGTGMENPSGT